VLGEEGTKAHQMCTFAAARQNSSFFQTALVSATTDQQVILTSTRQTLLLDCCELFKSLLFPFELCAPYVPHLTEPFMSCLEFPGATFVGIHDDGDSSGLANTVRQNIPEDSIIVELDSGEIKSDGNR
jgi:hypothetical protein